MRDVYNKDEGDVVKALDNAQTALDVAGMVPVSNATFFKKPLL